MLVHSSHAREQADPTYTTGPKKRAGLPASPWSIRSRQAYSLGGASRACVAQ